MSGVHAKGSILFITYHFAPENVSGTHRALHFARALQMHGHSVYVITAGLDSIRVFDESLSNAFPFPDRIIRVDKARTIGDLYLSIKQFLRRFQEGEPTANGAAASPPVEPTGSEQLSILSRMRRHGATWIAFPDEHRSWQRNATRAGMQLAKKTPIRAIFTSGPPWTGVLTAWQLSRKLMCPLIVDCRDPWTSKVGRIRQFVTGWSERLALKLERQVFQRADLLLFNSPGMQGVAEASYEQLGCGPFRLILNGTDAPRRSTTGAFPSHPPLTIRHFGSLYIRRRVGRSLTPLCDALAQLRNRGSIRSGEVCVELFGAGMVPGDVIESWHDSTGTTLRVHDRIPYSDATALMQAPSVLLVVQPAVFKCQIPTKLFDYLASGNPVLVLAPEDSATWGLARAFARCWRLDETDSDYNASVLKMLFERWRRGELRLERTMDDTAALTKEAIAEEFVCTVEAVLDDG